MHIGSRVLVCCLAFGSFYAQEPGADSAQSTEVPVEARIAERLSYGLDLLKTSQASAETLGGGMRPWALIQVARGYMHVNKTKAIELLGEALAATQSLAPESQSKASLAVASLMGYSISTRARLQEEILRELAGLAPEKAEGLLDQVDAEGRATVLISLLPYYENRKDTKRVEELIYQVSAEKEMPYAIATRLMKQMKSEDSNDFRRMFVDSLRSYRNHAPHDSEMDSKSNDFSEMVLSSWKRLPKQLVGEAIDEILQQADPERTGAEIKTTSFSAVSPSGLSAFGSSYEYRLLQLLPVLQEVDAAGARKLLQKYPQLAWSGTSNDGASSANTNRDEVGKNMGRALIVGGHLGPRMIEFPRTEDILSATAKGAYDDAITKTENLGDPGIQAACYEAIAHGALKKDPLAAQRALKRMVQAAQALDPPERVRYYRIAGEAYIVLNSMQDAKSMVEKGLEDARRMYVTDADEDDPNRALKAFWPATDAYCKLLRLAGRISPPWALALLKEVDDAEVRVTVEAALANEWLGSPEGHSVVMTITKKGTRMTTAPQ